MADINSVVLVGRLTRDAELRYTQSGTAAVTFSLAQTHRKKSGDTWGDEAHFFDVAMMGKGAEAVHKFLVKGKQVCVQGELRQRRWEKDGQQRAKVEVFAFSLQLLGGGDQKPQNSQPNQYAREPFDDDVPFI